MAPPPATSGSRAVMSEVDGRIIELRIRISRPAEGSTRCNVSRAQAQPRNSSQLTPPSTIPSTSSATSHQPEHTAPSARRRSIHGATPWRLLETAEAADLFHGFFDNVTTPGKILIEDTGVGTALIAELKDAGLYAIAVKPERDKATRMSIQTGKFESGQVWFPNKAPWLADLEAEFFAFPNGRYDDQVDSISQALAHHASGYDSTMSWVS